MIEHILALVWLLTVHLIADFVLQSREMGKRKGVEIKYLIDHVFIVLFCFMIGAWWLPIKFAVLNAAIHGLIDGFIWKAYKASVGRRAKKFILGDRSEEITKLLTKNPTTPWRYWEDQKFYLTIGIDQWLHAVTILLLYGMFA